MKVEPLQDRGYVFTMIHEGFAVGRASRVLNPAPRSAVRCGSSDARRGEPRPLPTMKLNPAVTDFFAFRYEGFAQSSRRRRRAAAPRGS